MIRTEDEYQRALERLRDEKSRLRQQQKTLRDEGLKHDQIKRALDPFRSFHAQLAEEVAAYERLRRGEFDDLDNLAEIGPLLIALRVHLDVTQSELARRLDVDPSQVSRDERNEYHGVSVQRAAQILDALGVQVRTSVIDIPSVA